LSGSIGCGALGVSGGGGDSVIRLLENITEDISFPSSEGIVETISESVTIQVT